MLILWRLLAIIITPALTWLVWLAAPDLLSFTNLRFLVAVFGICWGMAFYFLRKTGEMTGLPGLSVRERDRMSLMMRDIRQRVQWIAAVTVICPLIVWFSGAALNERASWAIPVVTGLLVGVGVSYLVVLFSWLNEIHEFSDKIKLREARKESAEKSLKRISEAKKQTQGRSHTT